jgi:hypothetical protein
MSPIVQYFTVDGQKKFDIAQALRDSGWGVSYARLDEMAGVQLVDRNNPDHRVTIAGIRADPLFAMVFVDFEGGGWLCLDHAIEQFRRGD